MTSMLLCRVFPLPKTDSDDLSLFGVAVSRVLCRRALQADKQRVPTGKHGGANMYCLPAFQAGQRLPHIQGEA